MTRLLRRPRAGNALFCDRRGDARGRGWWARRPWGERPWVGNASGGGNSPR